MVKKGFSNGCIVGDGTIAIDHWDDAPGPILHFLTHLHADHIHGLTSMWNKPIYTSELNCKLISHFVSGIREDALVPLEINKETAIPITPKFKVLVTLIDANHCPGAVMILIRGYFGNILYTGDFRFNYSMLTEKTLKLIVNREDLDEVYLDNTFFYETCDFPSRQEMLEKTISLIANHPEHQILIGIRKIGKEDVLVEVARRLKERILVSDERYEMLKIMDYPDVFTTDPKCSRIQCVHLNRLNRRYMESENSKKATIGIMLTALYYGWDAKSTKPYSISSSYGLHVIEYSDHSSYSEIIEFVKALKPKVVKPIVDKAIGWGFIKEWPNFLISRIDMKPLKPYLSKVPPKPCRRPKDLYNANELPDLPRVKIAKRDKRVFNQANHKVQEKRYRGPLGPIYETSNTTTSEIEVTNKDEPFIEDLKRVNNQFAFGFTKQTLVDLNSILDKIENNIPTT